MRRTSRPGPPTPRRAKGPCASVQTQVSGPMHSLRQEDARGGRRKVGAKSWQRGQKDTSPWQQGAQQTSLARPSFCENQIECTDVAVPAALPGHTGVQAPHGGRGA